MNSAPWVRLAILISPKISEKPTARGKRIATMARLFSVWRTQYCRSGLQIVRGREVARIDRVLEKLLRLIGPELAHVGIGVDDLVHQPSLLARDAADVDVAHHVPVLVERDRAAAGVHLDGADGLHESRFVLDVSADRVERGLQHSGLGVGRRSVKARVVFPFFAKARGKLFVDGVVDLRRVPAGGDDAERLVAHVSEHRLVQRGHATDGLQLAHQAVLVELPQEAESVRTGEAEKNAVDVPFELREIGSVVRDGERGEGALDDLSSEILEYAHESGATLVAIGDVIGDDGHAPVLEGLVRVIGEWMNALCRRRGPAREPRVE